MSAPPELTGTEARKDLFSIVRELTSVVMIEMMRGDLDSANRWLARNWSAYFTIEQQEAILVAFTTRRLTK